MKCRRLTGTMCASAICLSVSLLLSLSLTPPSPHFPFSPVCLFLFSKQRALYRKLWTLGAFRKAESRFPVQTLPQKKERKKKRREKTLREQEKEWTGEERRDERGRVSNVLNGGENTGCNFSPLPGAGKEKKKFEASCLDHESR